MVKIFQILRTKKINTLAITIAMYQVFKKKFFAFYRYLVCGKNTVGDGQNAILISKLNSPCESEVHSKIARVQKCKNMYAFFLNHFSQTSYVVT